MNENLVGYLLDCLEPHEKRSVEAYLEANPEARPQLESLRRALAPLELDAAGTAPPPDLVSRTLARVAKLQRPGLPPAPPTHDRIDSRWRWARRADVIAAAAVLFVCLAVGAPWLLSQWNQSRKTECAENLRTYWHALASYSDQHDGQFPRIEKQGPRSFAGSFVPTLTSAGVMTPTSVNGFCPAQGRSAATCPTLENLQELYDKPGREEFSALTQELAAGYAYTLGYWQGPSLCGLRRDSDALLPIMADRPAPGRGNSLNHDGAGQNVLYVDGTVKWQTRTTVGPNGDDIYCNRENRVFAGIDRSDAVLAPNHASPVPHE